MFGNTTRTGAYRIPNPRTMELLRTCIRPLFFLAAFIRATAALAVAPPAPLAENAVELTGWLVVDDLSMTDALVEVEVNGTLLTAPVSPNGRFTISLPANTEAVLRFEKPGHLTKEVLVDTRHLRDGAFGRTTARRVRFAVVLELERRMGGLRYTGPVGRIGFEEGGGCVAVQHTRTLVPARRQATMVF